MGEIQLYQICAACNGTGIRNYNEIPGGPLIVEDPCSECEGDGSAIAPFSLDDTLVQDIFDKVKKIKKTVEDIWDKINV